jgi:hypothetical protein
MSCIDWSLFWWGSTLGQDPSKKSKLDGDLDKVKKLLTSQLRKIAKFLGYNNHISLNTYIRKRKIKSLIII